MNGESFIELSKIFNKTKYFPLKPQNYWILWNLEFKILKKLMKLKQKIHNSKKINHKK